MSIQGIQTDFLRETESNTQPAIRRQSDNIIIPVLIRRETKQVEGIQQTVYRFFQVPARYIGQDISSYDKCLLQSYADIRKYFYGPASVQLQQQLKGTFAAHQYAVKTAFPKKAGQIPTAVTRFAEIKSAFWAEIDFVLQKANKTRDDLPQQPFNAETMLAWAVQNGLSAADIAAASTQIMRISLDLLHNGRNWSQLFD